MTFHSISMQVIMLGPLTCLNPFLLLSTSPCYIAILGPTKEQNQFWKWRGQCVHCKRPKQGLRALFCANFCYSQGWFPPCMKVWCGPCYHEGKFVKFHINQPMDDDGNLMYDDECDVNRYRIGIDDSHFMSPFQCNLCIF